MRRIIALTPLLLFTNISQPKSDNVTFDKPLNVEVYSSNKILDGESTKKLLLELESNKIKLDSLTKNKKYE